ncbi:MAG: ATPase [Parasporobacterium sp.]|nr:ATPase [Parasporobacterium sp.]
MGIEFGSTNIKAVLIGENNEVLASGSHRWVSHVEDGYFSYTLDEIREGLRDAYHNLKEDVKNRYGVVLKTIGCIGISAMMHGYIALDDKDQLLVPFRTWQNTTTETAARELSELFAFNIPERWSIAHLYQAILNQEPHVGSVAKITTLAGYVHYMLTGKHVLGIGDASGMFPVDDTTLYYEQKKLERFREKIASYGYAWEIMEILPAVLPAGEEAGLLSEEGAGLLDPEGDLTAGIRFCPPEGDAGTGMTATNAVRVNTGNVSAGTSIFSMIVLEKPLKDYYREIDMVATPVGKPVAMVHCNNCTNDMNAWAAVLSEFLETAGPGNDTASNAPDPGRVYETIYRKAAEGDFDCGGTVICNYIAGEPVTGMATGFPLVHRDPEKEFKLANLCRAFLYSAMTSLKIGMDVLKNEDIRIDRLIGHGGLFKNGTVALEFLASALRTQVCAMDTAEVGGPYGMALLAKYCLQKRAGDTLEAFLDEQVFGNVQITKCEPSEEAAAGIDAYTENFKALLERIRGWRKTC